MREIAIGVIDVGSPASGSLGWAIESPDATSPQLGKDLDEFVELIAPLSEQYPLAIGFEAPLFAPYRNTAKAVLKGRAGEGNRPWSAGAGAAVTAAALGVVPYTLRELRKRLPSATPLAGLDLPQRAGEVLFWEAFVTASAKGADHADDALIALKVFHERAQQMPLTSDLAEPEAFSLLGAALIRTGWTSDVTVLDRPCLVVRA